MAVILHLQKCKNRVQSFATCINAPKAIWTSERKFWCREKNISDLGGWDYNIQGYEARPYPGSIHIKIRYSVLFAFVRFRKVSLFVWLGFNALLKDISLIWWRIVHFTLLLALLRWKTERKPRKNHPRDCRSHILWLTHIPEGRQTDSILWTVHRSRLRKRTR